jgi:endonuclease/exonuclease/phosphatase family metal-dependent hydrolase
MSRRNTIRIATFNVENLFTRLAFPDASPPEDNLVGAYQFDNPEELKLARRIVEAAASDDKRQLTALALHACAADVVALQEVDNKESLEVFYQRYLKRLIEPEAAAEKNAIRREARRAGRRPDEADLFAADRRHFYDWRVVLDGNDGRGIDVGVLSKIPIRVRTHAHRTFQELGVWNEDLRNLREKSSGRERRLSQNDRLFRRDCLEVDLEAGGKPLTLYICHLKSMNPNRDLTRPLRRAESMGVRRIIEERFGRHAREANWVICGDMNDFTEVDGLPVLDENGRPASHGLEPFFADGFSENIARRRAPDDRWTTYHGPEDQYAQLDMLLVSPALAEANPDVVPDIIRVGQPFRAKRYEGPRFPRVGWDRPKASDHCPVVVELTLP